MAKERREPEHSLFIGQMGKSLYENSGHRVSGIARKRQRVVVVLLFFSVQGHMEEKQKRKS